MRIGVLGGTFNPVHLGHLIVAEEVREQLHLEQVLFVPCARPPHKPLEDLLDAEERYFMVKLAIKSNPYFQVSRVELDREGPSYSEETLRQFKNSLKDIELYWIVGTDATIELASWKEPLSLLKQTSFIVATRPGSTLDGLEDKFRPYIQVLSVTPIGISSTLIREKLRKGLSIKYLVPEEVENYIREKGFYI